MIKAHLRPPAKWTEDSGRSLRSHSFAALRSRGVDGVVGLADVTKQMVALDHSCDAGEYLARTHARRAGARLRCARSSECDCTRAVLLRCGDRPRQGIVVSAGAEGRPRLAVKDVGALRLKEGYHLVKLVGGDAQLVE